MKTKWIIPDEFWVKEPRHSDTSSDEKCYPYRSTRLCTQASFSVVLAGPREAQREHRTRSFRGMIREHPVFRWGWNCP